MKTLLLIVLLTGCSTVLKDLQASLIPAFQAESQIESALVVVDEEVQSHAKDAEEVAAWRAKRDTIQASLKLFHQTLTAVAGVFLK